MKKLFIFFFCVLGSVFLPLKLSFAATEPAQAPPASATAVPSPVGSWQTIDDVTQSKRSVILIQLNEQKQLEGKLIKINFRPGEGPDDLCVRCTGALHNQKVLGMTILTGLVQNSDNPLLWSGGKIVDPESGKTYSCKIALTPDGNTMKVRGYIGFSFIGRTQIWYRQ